MLLSLLMLLPIIESHIFRVFGSCLLLWHLVQFYIQGVYCLAGIQDFALMVYKVAFHLSGKVDALQLDSSTAESYLCNQGGTVSLFSFQTSQQYFESGWQAWCYSYSGIYTYPSECGSWVSLSGKIGPEWHLFPHIAQAAFHLWGQLEVDLLVYSCTNQCQVYYTLQSPLPVGASGLNAFNHYWTCQVSYMFPSPPLLPLLSNQVSGRTCHRSFQISYSSGTLVDGGTWLLTDLAILEDIPHWYPIIKRPHFGRLGRPGAQESAITAFNPSCCTDKSSLPSSIRHWYAQLEHLLQKFTINAGNIVKVVVLKENIPNNAISASK